MWIGAQPLTTDFLAVASKMLGVESALEECPSVDSGSGMGLEENEITALGRLRSAKEVVEANFENLRRGSIARNVTA
jgi:hypothetical protein